MATITTAAAGNFSAAGTWSGGVPPGLSDTMKMTYQVTLDGNYAIGAVDPASTAALVGSNAQYRLLVGSAGLLFIMKPIVV